MMQNPQAPIISTPVIVNNQLIQHSFEGMELRKAQEILELENKENKLMSMNDARINQATMNLRKI